MSPPSFCPGRLVTWMVSRGFWRSGFQLGLERWQESQGGKRRKVRASYQSCSCLAESLQADFSSHWPRVTVQEHSLSPILGHHSLSHPAGFPAPATTLPAVVFLCPDHTAEIVPCETLLNCCHSFLAGALSDKAIITCLLTYPFKGNCSLCNTPRPRKPFYCTVWDFCPPQSQLTGPSMVTWQNIPTQASYLWLTGPVFNRWSRLTRCFSLELRIEREQQQVSNLQ